MHVFYVKLALLTDHSQIKSNQMLYKGYYKVRICPKLISILGLVKTDEKLSPESIKFKPNND